VPSRIAVVVFKLGNVGNSPDSILWRTGVLPIGITDNVQRFSPVHEAGHCRNKSSGLTEFSFKTRICKAGFSEIFKKDSSSNPQIVLERFLAPACDLIHCTFKAAVAESGLEDRAGKAQ
jgi:hypothetical protein